MLQVDPAGHEPLSQFWTNPPFTPTEIVWPGHSLVMLITRSPGPTLCRMSRGAPPVEEVPPPVEVVPPPVEVVPPPVDVPPVDVPPPDAVLPPIEQVLDGSFLHMVNTTWSG